jgi:twitching motility protein PilT
MAQIDRLLSALVSNRAEALQLTENDLARLLKDGATHPLTKQPLPAQQLLGLLREIAPAEAMRQIDAGGAARFRYQSGDGVFQARATNESGKWMAAITHEGPVVAAPTLAPSDIRVSASTPGVAAAVPDSSARRAIDRLLRTLVDRKASDLHLRCGEPPILRLHGEMVRIVGDAPLDAATLEAMLLSIFPERNRLEFASSNDTDFAYEIAELGRFRANAFRERHGPGAVFRFIPATVVSADDLGLTPEVQALCRLSKGLVLVTGPTGSGKSTTLCALIDLVNRTRADHVITIEDPIEFVHANKQCVITQRQVGVHTSSFKHALRAALREDPDIVLVGELRDLETASIAIETAETGHLVFATLHTTTAASTIDRLIDQFPSDRQEQIRVMLAESLKGVISQILCKKIGGGRVAAREILLPNPAVSNLIREAKTFQIPSVMQTSRRLGMATLTDALMELVDAGHVEPREAYQKSVDKTGMANALRQRGHDTSFVDGEIVSSAPPVARPDAGLNVKTQPPRQGYATKR